MYTPQIVVDGREAIAGNHDDLVRRTVGSAAVLTHVPLRVTAREAAGHLLLTIRLPAVPMDSERIQVLAAVTEGGLTSIVKRGENSGPPRALSRREVRRRISGRINLRSA